MGPSDILRRQLHNLVNNTNLWITPEHKDNNKEDNNMQVINITIIDEVTKGSIEASIIGCDDAYKSRDYNGVETYLDIIFKMSDEILLFIKYAYDADHKITLKGDKTGDAYKDMIVRSFGPADKSLLHAELIKIEPIEKKSNIGLYGDNGSSLISDNIKVISCDDSYINNLRLVKRTKDIMFDADHHNLCLGINGKYKIIKYHGNMKIYERDIIIKDIRTLAGDWFEYEIEY